METKPILFNSEMVNALLQGRKTQTRRIIKPQPEFGGAVARSFFTKCKLGQVGDLLYVRESCRAKELENGLDGVEFSADNGFICISNNEKASDDWGEMYHYSGKKGAIVPSIHMKRWASRITLKITDVRVERVQDISEEDAASEGIEVFNEDGNLWYSSWMDGEKSWFSDQWKWHCNDPVQAFKELWDSINFKSGFGWAKNPYVWVITFSVIHKNVDEVIRSETNV